MIRRRKFCVCWLLVPSVCITPCRCVRPQDWPMRQGRPSFPFFSHQFWLCKFVACHRLPCKHIRHFQPCLQTWRVLLTQVDLFCKHGQNGLVCHRICTSCFSQSMSLCGGMVPHSSYIYHRLLGSCCDCVTRSECVTPADFDGAVSS